MKESRGLIPETKQRISNGEARCI